jgi:hypothetical protein
LVGCGSRASARTDAVRRDGQRHGKAQHRDAGRDPPSRNPCACFLWCADHGWRRDGGAAQLQTAVRGGLDQQARDAGRGRLDQQAMDSALRQEADQALRFLAVGGNERHGLPTIVPGSVMHFSSPRRATTLR